MIFKMKWMIEYILHMPCIFKEITGLYCPMCGGTRAMFAFLRFHFIESFLDNPIFIYMVGIAVWLCIGWGFKKLGKESYQKFEFRMWMLYVFIALMVVIFVGRNVAVYQFGYDYLGDLL